MAARNTSTTHGLRYARSAERCSKKCYIWIMTLHNPKYIDSPNQFICDGPTTLILDIEIDAKYGKFPSPENADGKIICVTVDISVNEGIVCYGLKEISQEVRDIITKGHGRYVTCKDERDLITKVLTSIYIAKPTHARGEDTIPALKFLTSRAEHLGIEIKVPDFDSMFRHYDSMPYAIMDTVRAPNTCPTAEDAWTRYHDKCNR